MENWPAAHMEQDDALADTADVPSAHLEHTLAPVPLA